MASQQAAGVPLTRFSRWRRVLPVVFVVASLLALGLLPLISSRRAGAIQREIEHVAEPARSLADQIQLALLREQALIVAFQVTEQSQYRDRAHQMSAARQKAYAELDPLVSRIGEEPRLHLQRLRDCTANWERSVVEGELLARDLPPPVFLQRLFERQPQYETCQGTAENLKSTIRSHVEDLRARVGGISRTQTTLTLILIVLAFASATLVIWLGHQTRQLAETAEQEREAARRQAERAELARVEAEHAEKKTAFLAEVSRELSASLEMGSVLQQLAHLLVPSFSPLCMVHLAENGRISRVALADADPGDEELLRAGGFFEQVLPDSPVAKAIETANPQLSSGVADGGTFFAHGASDAEPFSPVADFGPWMAVPLRSRDRVLGAITFVRNRADRRFNGEDLELAMRIASRTALAIDNAFLYLESQQAVRARDEILAIVSHDLRNPLTTIQMSASLLLEDAPESLRGDLEVIRATTRRMTRLIQDLLDVSTLEHGRRMSIHPEPVAVDSLLDEACAMFRSQIAAEGKKLECETEHELPPIHGDRDRLLQVFSNLIGNAVKFSAEGDAILIAAKRADDHVRFEIRDTGP
ncbi:MAG TPA: histidine kinase dimerization/phospho-acceptor domain-containing protein, partial [Thermoanaerobaculia bacterium]|nr:histidine kinase dimerization/phospho-acceptor domain-containing protein [Thermoanaerobaculia bacterium]